MKTSIWLAATLGTALALTAQTAQKDQTRTRAQDQSRDQAQTQTQTRTRDQAGSQDRLRKRDGSCGQATGAGQRLGQSRGRSGRGR